MNFAPFENCLIAWQIYFLVKHSGNLSIDQIFNVARQMRARSMARKLEGTVKEVLGTCQSVGCTVDGQHPHDIIDKIRNGDIAVPAEWWALLPYLGLCIVQLWASRFSSRSLVGCCSIPFLVLLISSQPLRSLFQIKRTIEQEVAIDET